MERYTLRAAGIEATLNLDVGMVDSLLITHRGQQVNPWARVPWYDAPDDDARFDCDMPGHLRHMSTEFFCAPFSVDDVEGQDLHGSPANTQWLLTDEAEIDGGRRATFTLKNKVAGASLEKIWTVLDGHPFLYQCHRFSGGTQSIPVAHHAMVDLHNGGLLAFSPRRWVETPENAPEKEELGGRSILKYPHISEDLTQFASSEGPVDLTRYPYADGNEDFAMLVDAPDGPFGWASVLRPQEQDLAILVKPVDVLPQTMLWMSNGGRPHKPWSHAHKGVLGIEDACAFGGAGWRGSASDNRLSRQGIPTAIDLTKAPSVEIRAAMGAMPMSGDRAVTLAIGDEAITLADGSTIPFRADLIV